MLGWNGFTIAKLEQVEPYLRGYFFVGKKSAQIFEKMNAFLNSHLNDKMKLYEFVRAFDSATAQLRNVIAMAPAKTESTSIVRSPDSAAIEMHTTEVYTRKVFWIV